VRKKQKSEVITN